MTNWAIIKGNVALSSGGCAGFTDQKLKEEYTLKGREGSLELFEELEDSIIFPRSILGFVGVGTGLFDGKIYDYRTAGRDLDIDDSKIMFSPREGQGEAIDEVVSKLHKGLNGGLLVAGCGKGKTTMAVQVMLRLKKSAIVLVHKEYLADQWEENLRRAYPEISIGRVQGDKADNGTTHDVVIGMVQSIVSKKREYPDSLYESFGILVCDEVHRFGAELWHKALGKFPAKYRLGLTATPRRADGFMGVIHAHIGYTLHRLNSDSIENIVRIVNVGTEVPDQAWDLPWLNKKCKRAKLVSFLASHQGRNKVVARTILKASAKGRKCMVISERLEQLSSLAGAVMAEGVAEDNIGFYVGGMKKKKRDIAAGKQLIFATYQMTKEGLDIEELDALIMASPQSDIEQTVGRILREMEGKSAPVTVDFVDYQVDYLRGIAHYRARQYQKMGCNVQGEIKEQDNEG